MLNSLLFTRYKQDIIPKFIKVFDLKNIHEVPVLDKITVSMRLGQDGSDKKLLESSLKNLSLITGRKPVSCKSKKSIAAFKLREGQTVGAFVTLRSYAMYYFLEKFKYLVIPAIKDFSGFSKSSISSPNSLSFGIKDISVFPEISFADILKPTGLDISFSFKSKSIEDTFNLLRLLGIPIRAKEDDIDIAKLENMNIDDLKKIFKKNSQNKNSEVN